MRNISRETIEKAAAGDMDAFEEIYKTFSSTVFTIALNVTRDRLDAEEAAQDVFVKIFRKLRDFKFESSFGTWIYRITINTAINKYHARSRNKQNTQDFKSSGEVAGPDAAKDKYDKEDAGSKVAGLLRSLSPEHRSCIVLRELEGLDYKEMAEVLRVPLNTVRSRLKRARQALIGHYRKEGVRYGLQ